MNAFARSNLAVALLRLIEAKSTLETLPQVRDSVECFRRVGGAEWGVREAIRLIEAATALDEMESVDTLPSPPDSGARRIG
jgi:hypothetical protein